MKISQIDKAIASLESEKAIIDMAIAKLRAQQQREKPAAKRIRARVRNAERDVPDNGE